jgi:hypothetical protein
VTLAACGGPTPTPTATNFVVSTELVAATATPAPPDTTATPAPTQTEAAVVEPSVTPITEVTVAVTPVASDELNGLLGDPVLRTYRIMVSMQVDATFLQDTAEATLAGEMEGDDTPVAALVYGALTQAIDEDVATVTPPPELADAWAAALAAHENIKQVAGQLLFGQLSAAEVIDALAPYQADLDAALIEADAAVAETYHVQPTSLTQYRARVTEALEKLFE